MMVFVYVVDKKKGHIFCQFSLHDESQIISKDKLIFSQITIDLEKISKKYITQSRSGFKKNHLFPGRTFRLIISYIFVHISHFINPDLEIPIENICMNNAANSI